MSQKGATLSSFALAAALMCNLAQASIPGTGVVPEGIQYHFRLHKDGGAIEVDGYVRPEFQKLADMFRMGDFDSPILGPDQNMPGVSEMRRLAPEITYTYEPTRRGGRVSIKTQNSQARKAVHEFLEEQIKRHRRIPWVIH
jgi:hypothetical protein